MKKKNSVKESWLIFSVIMLGVLLCVLIAIFMKNPFVNDREFTSGLTPLGTPIDITVASNSSNSKTVYFYGSLIPDMKIKQDVNIMLNSDAENSVARGKAFVYDKNNLLVPVEISSSSNWQLKRDGYYYCTELLTPNLKLDFVEKITIPKDLGEFNSTDAYMIVFTIETISENLDYENLWNIL